jgi:hypothetical protein
MPLAVSNNPKQEIRLNTKLEDVLNRDPVAEAEGLVEILQRAGLVEGDDGNTLLLGHALSVNKLKAEALEAVGDTNYGSKLTKYQAVIEKLGFRKVLELPFTGHKYGSEEAPQETFFVYFRDNGGVLLCFDTYNTDSVNGGHFYYNWKPNDIKDKYAYHVTSSGGWRVNYPDDMPAPKWEELYKDGVRLTSGPGIEKEERRNEYFHEHAVWVGDHDCREAIRHNISKLDLSLSAETLAERQTRLAALIAESKKAMFKFDKKAAAGAAPAGGAPATHGQPVAREDVPFADF